MRRNLGAWATLTPSHRSGDGSALYPSPAAGGSAGSSAGNSGESGHTDAGAAGASHSDSGAGGTAGQAGDVGLGGVDSASAGEGGAGGEGGALEPSLFGANVTLEVRSPVSVPISEKMSAVVGPDVEFPTIEQHPLTGYVVGAAAVDVTARTIEVRYHEPASRKFAGSSFNGYVVDFDAASLPFAIQGLAIDPATTADLLDAGLYLTDTSVRIDVGGLTVKSGSTLVVSLLSSAPDSSGPFAGAWKGTLHQSTKTFDYRMEEAFPDCVKAQRVSTNRTTWRQRLRQRLVRRGNARAMNAPGRARAEGQSRSALLKLHCGISTVSITWITPFLAKILAAVTFESLILTPPVRSTVMLLPLSTVGTGPALRSPEPTAPATT